MIFASVLLSSLLGEECTPVGFRGFDSRLKSRPVAAFPPASGQVLGFEVLDNKFLLLFSHRLLVTDGEHSAAVPSIHTLRSLMVDAAREVRVQTPSQVLRLGRAAWEVDPEFTRDQRGKLSNSGHALTADILATPHEAKAFLRRPPALEVPLFRSSAPLRCASWGPQGLAAVAGQSALALASGSDSLRTLAVDPGFAFARDTCLIGPGRMVVSLENVVVLVTSETVTVLAAMSARCRFAQGGLYLLESSTGTIWRLDGLERIGGRKANLEHARELIALSSSGSPKGQAALGEAARLVGCRGVDEIGRTLRAR